MKMGELRTLTAGTVPCLWEILIPTAPPRTPRPRGSVSGAPCTARGGEVGTAEQQGRRVTASGAGREGPPPHPTPAQDLARRPQLGPLALPPPAPPA